MLDFLLGLIIGRSNPNQCFTDKKYNKYLENQRRIKEEAFRQREEKERKEREERLKKTCSVSPFYRDENIYNIIRGLTLNQRDFDKFESQIKKGYGYMFFIEVGEISETGYIYPLEKVFKNRSLDKTVAKFIELCNSDEHHYRVAIEFGLGNETIVTTRVMSWCERYREVVYNTTPLFSISFWKDFNERKRKLEEKTSKEGDENDDFNW